LGPFIASSYFSLVLPECELPIITASTHPNGMHTVARGNGYISAALVCDAYDWDM